MAEYGRESEDEKRLIGRILKHLRTRRALSQDGLSKRMEELTGYKCGRTHISKYETGENFPTRLYLRNAAKACGVHPLTIEMCLLHDDEVYWEVLAELNAAAVIDEGVHALFQTFGTKLKLFEKSDVDVVFGSLSVALKTKMSKLDEPHLNGAGAPPGKEKPRALNGARGGHSPDFG